MSDAHEAALVRLTAPEARQGYAHVVPVLEMLGEAGHEAYLVGGGIRDLLLGRRPGDWDVATSARPEQVLEIWPEAVPTGLAHGTVLLPEGGNPVEITTYRTEGPYRDGRHPDWVRFGATLEEDLLRRDFAVNALAYDPRTNRLEDPAGGLDDLGRRRLAAVGNPEERFAEDGLRPLRGIRLAVVLDFSLAPATLEAMGRQQATVAGVARERVRVELLKLLMAHRPSRGIELLRRTGLLTIVLPELLESVGVSQNRFHAYDVYEHSLRALDAAPRDRPLVRLAALLHDVGKPRTRKEVDGEGTFHGHQTEGARMTRGMLERLRFSGDDRDRVAGLVEEHMFHYTPDWSDGAVRRFLRRVGVGNVPDLFALRMADDVAQGTGKDSREVLADLEARIEGVRMRDEALSVRDLAVGGRDIMEALGLEPGPRVGEVLEELLELVLERPELNERELLLALARERAGA